MAGVFSQVEAPGSAPVERSISIINHASQYRILECFYGGPVITPSGSW